MSARLRSALVLLFATALVPLLNAQEPAAGSEEDRIFTALNLREGMTACEIGAGSGGLTIAAGRLVGSRGKVYASELGESRLAALRREVASSGLAQITVVDGDPNETHFPDGACDALFMRNVYHHFDDPPAMNASIMRSLRNGGRVAVIDFKPRGREAERPQDRDGGDGTHGVSAETVERELKRAGFLPLSTIANGEGFLAAFSKGAR